MNPRQMIIDYADRFQVWSGNPKIHETGWPFKTYPEALEYYNSQIGHKRIEAVFVVDSDTPQDGPTLEQQAARDRVVEARQQRLLLNTKNPDT